MPSSSNCDTSKRPVNLEKLLLARRQPPVRLSRCLVDRSLVEQSLRHLARLVQGGDESILGNTVEDVERLERHRG